ncbi:hypothetical protein K493DRAFT_380164 [Basidiobolus meristosporus CBS 931.73]|uniref:Uncharacterized protein n=1 Tax=Basidiobolus meristosporus CBS 931.73 TaxID=1314790 RepID=A0A1Y1XYE2_9FUNG|nr:hypothetical protein K493DRAFT_380164 [Basidiobolus meristosporus CBS 931.73]|eukprot:ORX90759.1 hypothetical protein K493DRAFT_380164 [Basidiobolus meristosporus CBS 931.73]
MDKYYYEYQGSQPPKRPRGSYQVDPRNQKFSRNEYNQEIPREQMRPEYGQDTNRFPGLDPQMHSNPTLPAITNIPSLPQASANPTISNFAPYHKTSTSLPSYPNPLNSGTMFERERATYGFQKEPTNSTSIPPQSYGMFDIQSNNNNPPQGTPRWTDNAGASIFSNPEHYNRNVYSAKASNVAPRSGSYVFNNVTDERSGMADPRQTPIAPMAADQRYASSNPHEYHTGTSTEKMPSSRMENLNQYQYVSPFGSAVKQENYPHSNLIPDATTSMNDAYRKESSVFRQTSAPTSGPSNSYLDEIFRRKQTSTPTAEMPHMSNTPTSFTPQSLTAYKRELPQHMNSTYPPAVENQPSPIITHQPSNRNPNINDGMVISNLTARHVMPSAPSSSTPHGFQNILLSNPTNSEGNRYTSPARNPQANTFTEASPKRNGGSLQSLLLNPPIPTKPSGSDTQPKIAPFTGQGAFTPESGTPITNLSDHLQPSRQSEQPLTTESVQGMASFLKQASGQGVYNLSEENANSNWMFLTNTVENPHPPEIKRPKSLDVPIINPSKSGHHNIGMPTSTSTSSSSQNTRPPLSPVPKQETLPKPIPPVIRPSSSGIRDLSISSTAGPGGNASTPQPSDKVPSIGAEPRATSIIGVAVDKPKIDNVLGPDFIVAPPPHAMYDRDKLVTKGVELWIRYAGEESVTTFSEQLKDLIGSQYPSDRKFLLEHVIAVWLTWEPEKFQLILEPLSAMVKKRKRIYNKRASPFYALVQLFNPTTERVSLIFDPTAELQADYSIDVKCPDLCQNLLQYLTEENTNDHLVTWIIDCLSITSPLVQKRYFKWLIEKIDWDDTSNVGTENTTNYMHQLLSLLKDDKNKSTMSAALVSVFFTSWKNREALFKSQELRPTLVNYFNNPGSIAAQNQLYILLADEPEDSRFAIILELLTALKEHSEPGSIKWFYNLILPVMIDVIVEKDQSLAAHLFETLVIDEAWFSFLFFNSKDIEVKSQELGSLEALIQPDASRGLLLLVQAITQLEQYNIQSRISDMWLHQWKRKKIDRLWILALISLYPQSPKALQEMVVQLVQCTLDHEVDIGNSDHPVWYDMLDMFTMNKIPGLSPLFEATFNMLYDNPQTREQAYTRFEECLAKLSESFVAEVVNKSKLHGKKSKKKKPKWSSSAYTVSQTVAEFAGLLNHYLSSHRTIAAARALGERILASSAGISLSKLLSLSPLPQIRAHTVSILVSLTTIAEQDPVLVNHWIKMWEGQDLRTLVSLLADSDDLVAEKARSFIVQLLSLEADVSTLRAKIKNELNRDCRSSSDKINRLSAQPDQLGALGPLRIILARQQAILHLVQGP